MRVRVFPGSYGRSTLPPLNHHTVHCIVLVALPGHQFEGNFENEDEENQWISLETN